MKQKMVAGQNCPGCIQDVQLKLNLSPEQLRSVMELSEKTGTLYRYNGFRFRIGTPHFVREELAATDDADKPFALACAVCHRVQGLN